MTNGEQPENIKIKVKRYKVKHIKHKKSFNFVSVVKKERELAVCPKKDFSVSPCLCG
jgi:hypothetical protein